MPDKIIGRVTNNTKQIDGVIGSSTGVKDHDRLSNRDKENQHPIAAITELQEILNSKLDTETAMPLIEEAISGKAKGLYYDALKELDKKAYWYLTSEIDPVTKQGTKDSIISGPYDLGQGGGGGGGVTTVTISQVDWPSIVVLGSQTNITVYWTSVKGDPPAPTGNGTLYLSVNNKQVEVKTNQQQGEVTFDISKYIVSGTNTVQVRAMDAYGTIGVIVGSINTVSLALDSKFNYKLAYPLQGTTGINYTYIPYGDVAKTVYFYVDDILVGTQTVLSTAEQQTFYINALTHGEHTLDVYFTAEIDGEIVRSNTLHYALIYHIAGNKTPIIASDFNNFEQEQYIPFNIGYRVYIEDENEFDVEYFVGHQLIKQLKVNSDEQFWEYKNDIPGYYLLEIHCGITTKQFNIHINESTIHVTPVTQNLALALQAQGRSNGEKPEERIKWEDTDNHISCILTGFNWASNGWVKDADENTVLRLTGDARVTIPYKPFEFEFKDSGKTIELEIATSAVCDYETKIISCFDESRGFYLTPQIAVFKSQQSEISTQYKEDDHVRIAFVIEKNVETRIIWMYINGIASGAVQYPIDDSFRQLEPMNIILGSNDATLDIYNIRVYDNNLTSRQIVNNWIADTQNASLKAERYTRNDNYNDRDQLIIEKLPSTLPYMIWDIQPLPQYKGDKRLGNARFIAPLEPEKNFTSENATYNVQGTSSAVYPVKNIRIKYKANKDFPTMPFSWYNDDGDTIKSFAITDGGIGDNYFTYKVDFASSEGANNVELVKLYNDASKQIGILTPPQRKDSKVRVGIDGFPIAAFWQNSDSTVSFCTKANFNNDKANEAVYGLEPSKNWAIGDDESWEITNNTSDLAKFKVPVTAENFDEAFEIRFPDNDVDFVRLKKPGEAGYEEDLERLRVELASLTEMTTWVASTQVFSTDTQEEKAAKLARFKEELPNYFDVDSTLFYYIFTHLYLMIDSRAKNAFPTYFKSRVDGDGGNKWFWLPYDMDTAIGINNEGKLVFDYSLEDIDKINGADVFNGQDSVLWNNVREAFATEIAEMYSTLRAGRLISFEETEARFEEHQNKWSENIFNEDSKIKYVNPLALGDNYLEMLQGAKAEQRKWWLYNRFKYIDSKYNAGDAKADFIQFRAYVEAGEPKPNITITPYADIYATVSYKNGAAGLVSKRAKRDIPIVVENPTTTSEAETDQETYIYSASQLKSIGDISGFKPDTIAVGNAIKLQELKIGDASEDYDNPNLTSLYLGNNTLLKSLDVRNCSNLTQPIDVSNCINLEEIYFTGTKITGINLPDGGVLKHLHLPETLKALKIKNQPLLTDVVLLGESAIESLWLEYIPSMAINLKTLLSNLKANSAVRLIGISEHFNNVAEVNEFYDLLDTMKGQDAEGTTVDKAQITGTIYINDVISYDDYTALKSRYGADIIAIEIRCRVTFYNYKQEQSSSEFVEYYTTYVDVGNKVTDIIPTPTRIPETTIKYNFNCWYIWNGSQKEIFNQDSYVITSNLNIYPEYTEETRLYRINFYKQTGYPVIINPEFEEVEYRQKLYEPTRSEVPELSFAGWYTELGVNWDFENDVVESDFDLYARWNEVGQPSVVLTVKDFNTFTATCQDNVGVAGWQLTTTNEQPTTWNRIIPSVFEYIKDVTITTPDIYYFWIRDNAYPEYNIASQHIQGCSITKTSSVGVTSLKLYKDDVETDTNIAFENSVLKVVCTIDNHYENLVIKVNGIEVPNNSEFTILTNTVISAECTPKVYTVHFDLLDHEEKPIADQYCIYNTLVIEPEKQIVPGYVLDGWYRYVEQIEPGQYIYRDQWDFNNDRVEENTTLFAKWTNQIDPSRLYIITDSENAEITVRYYQSIANGVSVDWGDETETSSSADNLASCSHTYSEPGNYVITFNYASGTYYLGTDLQNQQAVDPITAVTNVEFANNTPKIGNYAFKGATNLTTLTLSPYLRAISYGAFQDCTNLTNVHMSYGIVAINGLAFNNCVNLVNINFPESLETIGNDAFSSCKKLIVEQFPSRLRVIDGKAFSSCNAIETLNLSNIRIGAAAFTNCVNLREVTLSSITEPIGDAAFNNCSSLTKVHLLDDSINGNFLFQNCSQLITVGPLGGNYNIEYNWDHKVPDNIFAAGPGENCYITTVQLSNNITEIGSGAFSGSDIQNVNLDNIVDFGDAVFYNCKQFNILKWPAKMRYLPNSFFANCTNLIGWDFGDGTRGIKIPKTVKINGEDLRVFSIGNNVFAGCTKLNRVDVYAGVSDNKVTDWSKAWFVYANQNTKIHVITGINYYDFYGSYFNWWNSEYEYRLEVLDDLIDE